MKVKNFIVAIIMNFILIIFINLLGNSICFFYPKISQFAIDECIVCTIRIIIIVSIIFMLKYKLVLYNCEKLFEGILYSLPLILFYLFFCGQAINWIFIKHFCLYMPKIKTVFGINFISCLLVGIAEELTYRGLTINYLLEKLEKSKKNYIYAVIASSFIFSIGHFGILFMDEADIIMIIMTFLITFMIGFYFAVIYLKTNNLLFISILHWGWNFTSFCNWQMAKNRYRYTGEIKFYLYQFIVALIMGVISILILYKNPAEQFLKSCKSLAVLHR